MAEIFAAQCIGDPDSGVVEVEVSGTTTSVAVASGLNPSEGDVVLITKVGGRWFATQILYNAPVWTAPSENPPPAVVTSGTNVFSPVETRSWRPSTGWRTDTDRVYQGQYQGYGLHKGCAFYGSGPSSLAGATVTAATVRIRRDSGSGYVGGSNGQLTIARYSYKTRPSGEPTVQATFTGPNLPKFNDETVFTVPNTHAQALVDGTSGALGLYEADGSPYVVTLGLSGYSAAWQLSITWQR